MAISLWKVKWKKDRDPGRRAGLSREIIIKEAARLFAVTGPDEFSMRLVARRFYVFPAAIRSFFKRGVNELRRAIACAVLAQLVAPPFNPSKQAAESYLIDVMRSAAGKFREEPHLGRLAIAELTNDPLVSPAFAEQICSALVQLAPKRDPISGLELFVGRLAALTMVECGAWGREDAKGMNGAPFKKNKTATLNSEPEPGDLSAMLIKTPKGTPIYISSRLALLDPNKFPTLTTSPKLGGSLVKRAAAGYLDNAAAETARAVIAGFTRGSSKKSVGEPSKST